MRLLVAVVVPLLLVAPRASAQCGRVVTDVFDLADHAAAIAFVEPDAAAVRVVQAVAGDAAVFAHLVPIPAPPTPSPASPRRPTRDRDGRRIVYLESTEVCPPEVSLLEELDGPALAFVDARGAPVSPGGSSAVTVGTAPSQIPPESRAAWATALAQWSHSRDARPRAALLYALTARGDRLAMHAATRLGSDLRLVAALDRDARAGLAARVSALLLAAPPDVLSVELAARLAHLHEPATVPAIVAAFRRGAAVDVGASLDETLELLTLHAPAAADGAGSDVWQAWADAHRSIGRDAMLRAGWLERGLTPPDPADRPLLAWLIRKLPEALDRTVAADLCALETGRNLVEGPSVLDDVAAAAAGRVTDEMATAADRCAAP